MQDPTPSPAPVPPPTKIPTVAPVVVPTTSSPTYENQLPTFDKPTILIPNRPPVEPTLPPGCTYTSPITGQLDVVAEGDIFDVATTGIAGPCEPHEEWPVFCNTQIPTQREYPYCVFDSTGGGTSTTTRKSNNSGDVICARPGEEISVPQSDGTIANCACAYLNPLIGVVSNCPMVVVDLSDDPTEQQPTSAPDETTSPTQSSLPSDASPPDDDSSCPSFYSASLPCMWLAALFLLSGLWI